MLASLLLAVLALPQEPSGPLPAVGPDQTITASWLGSQIDRSLRWLHTRFQVESASFGSPAADAWALLAYAESPRRYRSGDGPFIDGPLAALLRSQTSEGSFPAGVPPAVALRVLELLGEDAARAAATRLRSTAGSTAGSPAPEAGPASAEQAVERVRAILAERNPDGSFGKGSDLVVESARRIVELDRCHAMLAAQEPAKAPRTAQPLPAITPAEAARVDQALARGAEFLLSQSLEGGFGLGGRRDAGVTAMVAGALQSLREPRPAAVEAAITKGLDWLLTLQRPDGSIHEGQVANYVTSAAVLALAKSGREQDLAAVARARAFLQGLQADEPEGYSPSDRLYGGVGYGDDERPDLSNLQMALEALNAAGVPPSDASFQKALAFLQRCQNRSESNDLALEVDGKTVVSGNDGGAAYAPGDSKAGFVELADGRRVPRSYGSMSYALLKGYLFAGLTKEDARVQAVWKWLRENYTLDVNPGFQTSDDPVAAYQGLFYYFYTLSRALDLFAEETIVDAAGREHAWRSELCGRLVAMQRQDGSWVNANASRWLEGEPVLATAYALLSLGNARE